MSKALAAALFAGVLVTGFPGAWPAGLLQIAAFALALACLFYRRPLVFHWLLVPLAALPLWGLAQLAAGWSVYRFATWTEVLNRAAMAAVFFASLQAFREPRARGWFLRALLWFAAALSVLATVQTFTSHGKIFWLFDSGYQDQVLGPFVARNRYAAFIELTLPLAVLAAFGEPRKRIQFGAIAGAMFASVIAGASRAGTALVTAEVAALVLLAGRGADASAKRKTAAWVALCAIAFTAVVGWREITNRFRTDTAGGRWEFAQSTLEMIRARPWTGWGLGAWPEVYPSFAVIDVGRLVVNRAHNDWLEWTAEGGLPYAAIMLIIAAWGAAKALRCRWGLGVLAVFLHSWVDYPTREPALAAILFVLLGALASPQPVIAPPSGSRKSSRTPAPA